MDSLISFATVVKDVGIAVIIAVYFIIKNESETRERALEVRNFQTLLTNNTQAIQDNSIVMTTISKTLEAQTKEIERVTEKIEKLEDDVMELKGALR